MPWFRISLPRECSASAWKTLQDSFEIQFVAEGAPGAMALFRREIHEGQFGLFAHVANASALPSGARWEPCDQPPAEGTSFLVGHADAGRQLLR